MRKSHSWPGKLVENPFDINYKSLEILSIDFRMEMWDIFENKNERKEGKVSVFSPLEGTLVASYCCEAFQKLLFTYLFIHFSECECECECESVCIQVSDSCQVSFKANYDSINKQSAQSQSQSPVPVPVPVPAKAKQAKATKPLYDAHKTRSRSPHAECILLENARKSEEKYGGKMCVCLMAGQRQRRIGAGAKCK